MHYSTIFKIALNLSFLCLFQSFLWSQTNFDQYTGLKSAGSIPTDFLTKTSEKIQEDARESIDELSKREQKVFIEQINFSIDQVLHSGKVTFGDPISKYVESIAKRLLSDDPGLFNSLRFYTYNSAESNAFSTRQGMIFVTTGLIAQMTSEAQLAFVLGHEIVHYEEEHVLSLYKYNVNNKFSYYERVRFLTNYSRENELEADAKAVKMLQKAGYSNQDIQKTFDALLYSYLPFEEFPYDFKLWNTDQLFIPAVNYKYNKTNISAKTNYDDRYMSHPNLEKRKDKIEEKIDELSNWGTSFGFDSSKFIEIRDICRFEFVQEKLYADSPVEVLYAVQMLQRKFPDSHYLKSCEAQAWLLLMKPKRVSNSWSYYAFFDRQDKDRHRLFEGEISVLDQTIKNMSLIEKVAVGLRKIRDIFSSDTTNATFQNYWSLAKEIAAENDEFVVERFGKENFQATGGALNKVRDAVNNQLQWDKYKIIEMSRTGLSLDKGIDSTKYFYYCLSDLMIDSTFLKEIAHLKRKKKIKEKEEEAFFLLTDAEQEENNEIKYSNRLHVELDSVMIFSPSVYELKQGATVDVFDSEKTRSELVQIIHNELDEHSLTGRMFLRDSLQEIDVDSWNLYTKLMRTLEMAIYTEKNDVFVQDLEFLQALKDSLGVTKIMFTQYTHTYHTGINVLNAAVFTVLLPVGLVYFPVAILSGHKSDWQLYILDLETGKIEINTSYFANEPATKKFMSARMNALFNQLKQANDEE
jgi:hypothetical protein